MILRNLSRKIITRACSAGIKTKTKWSKEDSVRELKKDLYEVHKNLLYSSHLECELALGKSKSPPKQRYSQQSGATKVPVLSNWMHDYEFYEAAVDENGIADATMGSVDTSIPPSHVPCNGCGAHLHCTNASLPGFIPSEIFVGRTKTELQTIICKRCYFLKHYNVALDVDVTAETYVETISKIQDKFALAIVIVDLLDFPCSIWPGLVDILGEKRPIFIVGNKVDLLPCDSKNYLDRIKQSLQQHVIQYGFNALNVKYISLISAKTGFGVEELITQLHNIWRHKGDVYLIGCTNVGKSSLFNLLLNSDYCRTEASKLVRRATTCPWPGTTLQMLKFPILRPSDTRVYQRFLRLFSERMQRSAEEKLKNDQAKKRGKFIGKNPLVGKVGRTFDIHEEANDAFAMSSGTNPIRALNERSAIYKDARWCYDTPGVVHPAQITNLLTSEELSMVQPKSLLIPRALRLPIDCSLFIAGLARVDFVATSSTQQEWIKVIVFSSKKLPLLIAQTKNAEMVYKEYLGTSFLSVPMANRNKPWPGLQAHDKVVTVRGSDKTQVCCDIVLSSSGWIGLQIPENDECSFLPWTPEARGIYVRRPSLIPFADSLVGKHVRDSLGYNVLKPSVSR